jgi:hypothetical protein
MTKKIKSLVVALALSASTIGAIDVNVHLDNQKLWDKASRGELYVTAFNNKEYSLLKNDLHNQVDKYVKGGEPLTYQAVMLYLATVSYEAGKDKGWVLENVNNDNFLPLLNNKLKDKLK